MGKRELLLISGFAVIGLLVYQLTMPATADTGGGFAAWWARVRSHVGQNRVEQHYERKDEVKVPAAIRTVAVQLDRASVTILGEARDTLAVDLSGVVYGGDEEMAKAHGAGRSTVGRHHGRAACMKLATTLPKRDELARRPRVQLHAARPGPARHRAAPGRRRAATSPTWARVQVVRASGRIRLRLNRRRRHRRAGPGRDQKANHAGSVAMRPATARSASPTSPARSRSRRDGAISAPAASAARRTSRGATSRPSWRISPGPLRLTGSGGEVRVRDVRGPITAETERTTLKLTPGTAVEISATTEHDADRTDAADGWDRARREGDGRRHPHAGRADRRATQRRGPPQPAVRCAAAVRA